MFGAVLVGAVAYGGAKAAVEAGVYVVTGHVLVVGKKAKTLQWDDGEVTRVKAVASNLLVDGFLIGTPVITVGGATWFPDYLVVGQAVYSSSGAYRWEDGGCVPVNEDQSAVDCAVDEAGNRTVDGQPLYQRGPDVWTSTMTPSFRGATVEEARRLARDAFVDATAKDIVAKAEGEWWSPNGDHHVIRSGVWTENEGTPRTMTPLAPCLVEVAEDGANYSLVWWSDGEHAAAWEAAAAVGDSVWGCEAETLVRFQGSTCESWSWSSPSEPGGVGTWTVFPGLCGGTKEEPGTFRTTFAPTDVPGLFTNQLLSRENAFPDFEHPPAE